MPGQIPTSASLPSSLTLSIILSPHSKPPANILLLLHSIGDTHLPFAQFATQLSLPETLCISLQGPRPMPFDLPGYQFGEDVIFDSGKLSIDAKFEKAGSAALKLLIKTLTQDLGWMNKEIFFFGWGQGGMCSLDFLSRSSSSFIFGGVISIGGIMPSDTVFPKSEEERSKTPVLLMGGSRGSLVTKEAEDKVKRCFESVETVRWAREGDGMMRTTYEVRPMMAFLGQRLLSRVGIPEGFSELA